MKRGAASNDMQKHSRSVDCVCARGCWPTSVAAIGLRSSTVADSQTAAPPVYLFDAVRFCAGVCRVATAFATAREVIGLDRPRFPQRAGARPTAPPLTPRDALALARRPRRENPAIGQQWKPMWRALFRIPRNRPGGGRWFVCLLGGCQTAAGDRAHGRASDTARRPRGPLAYSVSVLRRTLRSRRHRSARGCW
jgi:hypothetical protein